MILKAIYVFHLAGLDLWPGMLYIFKESFTTWEKSVLFPLEAFFLYSSIWSMLRFNSDWGLFFTLCPHNLSRDETGDWHHPVWLHQDMHDLSRPLVLSSQHWKLQFLVHIKLLYLVELFPSLICIGFIDLFSIVLC